MPVSRGCSFLWLINGILGPLLCRPLDGLVLFFVIPSIEQWRFVQMDLIVTHLAHNASDCLEFYKGA